MSSWKCSGIWKGKLNEAKSILKFNLEQKVQILWILTHACMEGGNTLFTTSVLSAIKSFTQTFKANLVRIINDSSISWDGLYKWMFAQHFKILRLKVLCKYWARLARHVSPCVHRAFTDFSGWNVVGESGSLLVFLFWFDQLLSITDIGNYPQKRRGGRKKLAIIIFILSVMVFSYIKKILVVNCVTQQVLILQCPWYVCILIQIFKNFSDKFHIYRVMLHNLSLYPVNSSSQPSLKFLP